MQYKRTFNSFHKQKRPEDFLGADLIQLFVFGNNKTVFAVFTRVHYADLLVCYIAEHIKAVAEKVHLQHSVLGGHIGEIELLYLCDADNVLFEIIERFKGFGFGKGVVAKAL